MLRFYRLVINDDTHEVFLFLVDGDGNIKDEVGPKDAIELFKGLTQTLNKRLKAQEPVMASPSSSEFPFGFPDAILQE